MWKLKSKKVIIYVKEKNMLELNKIDLESYKNNLMRRGLTFTVERKRGERHVIVNGKRVAKLFRKNAMRNTSKEESKKILSLFASVKKSVNKFIVNSDFYIEREPKKYNSIFTNRELFDSTPVNTKFYYIDVKHCYWRISYLRGYITKFLYQKILLSPDMKLYRNMALACVIAGRQVEYFSNGKKINEIKEDTRLHELIYENIRHYAWNLFGTLCFEKIGKENCIGYFTDGIMVFEEDLKKVTTTLARQKLQHRVINCQKTAHREYVYIDEGEIKTF